MKIHTKHEEFHDNIFSWFWQTLVLENPFQGGGGKILILPLDDVVNADILLTKNADFKREVTRKIFHYTRISGCTLELDNHLEIKYTWTWQPSVVWVNYQVFLVFYQNPRPSGTTRQTLMEINKNTLSFL